MIVRRLALALFICAPLVWAQPVTTQQGELLPSPRPATATTQLLFAYATAFYGFDTEITISNTSQDTLGSTPQGGTCTLNYFGSVGTVPAQQTTPVIAPGAQLVFDIGEGTSGIAAAPGFEGYVIADCGFPLARGFAKVLGGPNIAFDQDAQILSLPRSTSSYQYLLFPFVTDQLGYDSGIAIANTSADPFGTSPASGSCDINFFGPDAPQLYFTEQPIAPGTVFALDVSFIDPNFPSGNFQGYAIAECLFPDAAGVGFVSDVGLRSTALSESPELITVPRNPTNQPLLFSHVTNQNGSDTQITIANTTEDPFGTSPVTGSCTLTFEGANAPAAVDTGTIAPGTAYSAFASTIAPNFQGYVIASCTFPLALGWAASYPSPALKYDGDSDAAELITLPRSTASPVNLLFSAVSNAGSDDTSIAISNTSLDPLGTQAAAGACTVNYFGTMSGGGSVPSPQESSSIAAGDQLSFTLSGGNPAQGIAGAPGFSGYVIAGCGFPLARGLATVTSGCVSGVSATSVYLDATAQPSSIGVSTAYPSCTWSALDGAAWSTITSGASGAGNGTVALSVESNSTGASRTGSLTIGGQAVSVTQRETAEVFTDVTPSAYYFDFADLMYQDGITSGCLASPPEFCPNSTTTRGEMAVFIITGIEGSNSFTYTTTPYFTDVPASNPFFKFIQKMKDLGITGGCTATTFCPNDPVTRGEMAVFVIAARFGSVPWTYPSTPYFSDVPASNPFFRFIQKMAQEGITAGCGGGQFCPNESLTRGQMAVFVVTGLKDQLLPSTIPYITQVSPNTASPGQNLTVTLTGSGTNFVQGTTQVTAPPGFTVSNVMVTSATSLTAQFNISPSALSSTGATNGAPYSIVVTTGTQEADLPNGFIVE